MIQLFRNFQDETNLCINTCIPYDLFLYNREDIKIKYKYIFLSKFIRRKRDKRERNKTRGR